MDNNEKIANQKVNEWNGSYEIGQDVVLRKDFQRHGTITKTTSNAYVMCGSPVIMLEGISGCYDLDRVIPIDLKGV